jgi:dephospho-CoA kinase
VLRVGLTGNIGAGKSTVARMLADYGARVIDADRLGHRLLVAGSPVLGAIVEVFGSAVLDDDGNVDRGVLAERVFADAGARARLEAILHPEIRALEEAEAGSPPAAEIVVTEASLLVETGSHDRYDRLVVVTAPEAIRLDRLESRGLPRDAARRRMAAQMPESEKTRVADYVIDNRGSVEETTVQVRFLFERLCGDARAIRRGDALPPSPGR